MELSGASAPPPAMAGWYPDPGDSGSLRYWDGSRWTDALSCAVPPAAPHVSRDDARHWALAAHLSALLSLVVGLPFIGPLVVYLVKRDDAFVRRHAAEALSFNLSVLLYGVVIVCVALMLHFVVVGVLLVALFLVIAVLWIVCICLAATRAGQGAEYRYPLTIRLVR